MQHGWVTPHRRQRHGIISRDSTHEQRCRGLASPAQYQSWSRPAGPVSAGASAAQGGTVRPPTGGFGVGTPPDRRSRWRNFKNLASDYEKLKQNLHRSGVGTGSEPVLRNSHELYLLFDQYLCRTFLRGGIVLPFVMIEKYVTLFSESAATEFLADTSGADCSQTTLNGSASNLTPTSDSSSQPSTLTSQSQPSTSDSRPLSYIPPVRHSNC